MLYITIKNSRKLSEVRNGNQIDILADKVM